MTEDSHITYEQSEGSTDSEEIEEEVYTLLFQNCDEDHSGVVNIDHLVDYIGQQTKEDQEHEVRYNLDLLREMLHCSTKDKTVDEDTYTHVIRKWVQQVRSRSSSALSLSEVPPQEDDFTVEHSSSYSGPADVSKESLEASGGASSHSGEIDHRELILSLQLDNKRLQDTNHNLHHQIDQSEEGLGKLVAENNELKQRVKNLQQSLSRLQALENENHQLNSAVINEQEKCLKLSHSVDRQDQELHQLTEEMARMQSQLTIVHTETASAEEEKQALKRLLHQKEELIEKYASKQKELECQHAESLAEIDALDKKVCDLTGINESLRSDNAELQGKLVEPERHRGFSASTPFRPSLTFHDELLECSLNATNISMCPMQTSQPSSSDSMETADQSLDEFSKVLAETRTQIREKTELLDKGLTELMSTDAPPSGTSSRLEGKNESLLYEQFESKVSELGKSKRQSDRKVKKLSSDVRKLRSENQKLRDQLRQRSRDNLQDVNVEDNKQPAVEGLSTISSPVERMLGEPHVSLQDKSTTATCNVCVDNPRESDVRSSAQELEKVQLIEGEEQTLEQLDGVHSRQTFCRRWLWLLMFVLYHVLKWVLMLMAAVLLAGLLVLVAAQLHSNYTSCSFSPFRVLFSMFGSNVQLNHHGPILM